MSNPNWKVVTKYQCGCQVREVRLPQDPNHLSFVYCSKHDAAPQMYEALKTGNSVLSDIQQRESKTSFHGQRVASDCGEAIKVINEAIAKAEGRKP